MFSHIDPALRRDKDLFLRACEDENPLYFHGSRLTELTWFRNLNSEFWRGNVESFGRKAFTRIPLEFWSRDLLMDALDCGIVPFIFDEKLSPEFRLEQQIAIGALRKALIDLIQLKTRAFNIVMI